MYYFVGGASGVFFFFIFFKFLESVSQSNFKTKVTEEKRPLHYEREKYSHDFRSALRVLFLSLGAWREDRVAVFTRDSIISSSPSVKSSIDLINWDSPRRLLHVKVPQLSLTGVGDPNNSLEISGISGISGKSNDGKQKTYFNSASALSSLVLTICFTSVIILPRVLFRSLWFAFFSICCWTRSLVVRYSKANSERTLQNLFGLDSAIRCWGIPSHNKNLRYLRKIF